MGKKKKEKLKEKKAEKKNGKKGSQKKSEKKAEQLPKELIQEEKTQVEAIREEKIREEGIREEGIRKEKTQAEAIQAETPRLPSAGDGGEEFSRNTATTVFRALGDENRMQILSLLKQREMNGTELLQAVSIVQSTLSHHMKILTEAGLVHCRRQGKWSWYSVNLARLKQAGIFLESGAWEQGEDED